MKRYLLDTNIVSHLIKQHPAVAARLTAVPMAALCISSITEAELMFGLAKRPDAKRLHDLIHAFLQRVDVLPWDSAECYGKVRAQLTAGGKVLGALDLLIATQALDIGAVLVSNDQALRQIEGLMLEDWTVSG
ncbi:MAG: type II toxin-antitoxin system VapC family toxin [Gallionella sp.]